MVGAGPGDAELLTLKAERVLKSAEVVVYDALLGQGVLAMIPREAKRVYVGKRAGNHALAQDEITRLLVEEAKAGKRVVRLKGGDPFLFGRGGEELEALLEVGVIAEVIPGVTSPIAAAAYAGIPLTHRDYASSLHIYTAHAKEGGDDFDYEAMSRLNGTLVFLMGVTRLTELCEKLIGAGMDEGMPAAVVERGTSAKQRLMSGTLQTLPGLASAAKVAAPALIIVGKVAALHEALDWRKLLPLNGVRVAVTRPKTASRLAELLREQGAEVIELPCIQTRPVEADIPPLGGYDYLAFSSPAGVEYFFARMAELNRDIREFTGKVAAVGPSTAKALREKGLRVDVIPGVYDGAHLSELLSGKVLCVRPQEDSGSVRGDACIVYGTLPVLYDEPPEGVDVYAFASASAVRALCGAQGGAPRGQIALCIGESTAKAARDAGFEALVAKEASIPSVGERLIEWRQDTCK